MDSIESALPRLNEFIHLQIPTLNAPGLALGLTHRDKILHVCTYGLANQEARQPVTPETLFQIGSIRKSFTSMVLLQLQEQGLLSIHDAVTKHLPQFRRENDEITETIHGGERYLRNGNQGESSIAIPAEWELYPGHYRSHNPWLSNFRIVLRTGTLSFIDPSGDEQPLHQIEPGLFRLGDEPRSPEFIRFDVVIDGKAMQAILSGGVYSRTFTS